MRALECSGSLAFVAVRQKQDEAGGKTPLVFAGADELIDDDLRAVDEIAELRFPKDEAFGIVARETVFETEAGRFRERRIVDFAESLVGRKMREGQIVLLGFGVDKNGVALVEGAALGVLASEANGIAFEDEGAVGEKFGETVIEGALALAHF